MNQTSTANGKPVLWGMGGHVIKCGLAPVLIKKDEGPVVADERDQLFQRRAAIAGFATAYMVFGAACMIPFFVLGPSARISVAWLPTIFMGAGISHFFVYSLVILSQYGWSGKGEQE